ncbi:MAG: TRAP transporter large permease subunit [Verrucomicrobia bacterium]|nr:TRAP transporter large permease subunit [Verrucomicrobiota bacterium]
MNAVVSRAESTSAAIASCSSRGDEAGSAAPAAVARPPHVGRYGKILRAAEDWLVAAALGAMVALPLIELALRSLFHTGLAGSSTLVQHLSLFISLAGGALAARDGRLLAFSTLPTLLRGRWAAAARWFSHTIAATVAAALALASVHYVGVERAAGQPFLGGVPLWVIELVLPLGFAAIALRLAGHAADAWRSKILSGVGVAGLMASGVWSPLAAPTLAWPAAALLSAAAVLGAPVFALLGGAGLLLFWSHDLPIAAMPVEHYRLTVNPTLPAIPLFTLAGYFLAEGGASRRMVAVFQALAGHVRGGPAIAAALLCAFFTAFTGASGVTILALAGLLMPVLRAAKFSERDALGMMTGAGSLGILLPPCLPVIFYAMIAQVDMRALFLGGFVPGVLLIAMTAAWGLWAGRRGGAAARRFDPATARRALWDAKWELALPVVSLVPLFAGWASSVEVAALTAAYALFTQTVVHRDLDLARDGRRVMAEAGLLVGGILLILGVALGLTNYLVDAQLPDALAAWSLAHVPSRAVFLLGLNVVLLVVGGLVEIYAAIIVVVPLLAPVGATLGIDPVHLGVIFLANMELGFLAPPVGLNLLLASSRLQRPLGEVMRAVLPLLFVMFLGVLLITYVPALTTTLPRLLASRP